MTSRSDLIEGIYFRNLYFPTVNTNPEKLALENNASAIQRAVGGYFGMLEVIFKGIKCDAYYDEDGISRDGEASYVKLKILNDEGNTETIYLIAPVLLLDATTSGKTRSFPFSKLSITIPEYQDDIDDSD